MNGFEYFTAAFAYVAARHTEAAFSYKRTHFAKIQGEVFRFYIVKDKTAHARRIDNGRIHVLPSARQRVFYMHA